MFNLMRAENFESRAETRRELLLENLDDVFRVNKGPVFPTEKEITWKSFGAPNCRDSRKK
ncbi:MAG: hypothetical protein DME69_13630 [Verrucomicrobia bacterium]|nr:MAG: hypothetical protein DME69_13630 [Verrucomicrobiota bacterium]